MPKQFFTSKEVKVLSDSSTTESALITAKEVASLLGISVRSVWRMESSQQLPSAVRLGGLVRWQRSVIMQWIADGCPKMEVE